MVDSNEQSIKHNTLRTFNIPKMLLFRGWPVFLMASIPYATRWRTGAAD